MVSGTRCPAWSDQLNQLPKGNMWSIIPIALLCMIVNLREGKQGSSPVGDDGAEVLKNTEGLSLILSQRPERTDLKSEMAN